MAFKCADDIHHVAIGSVIALWRFHKTLPSTHPQQTVAGIITVLKCADRTTRQDGHVRVVRDKEVILLFEDLFKSVMLIRAYAFRGVAGG